MTTIAVPIFSDHAAPSGVRNRSKAHATALLGLYVFGFTLAHEIAQAWGGAGFYSLWYPAAGLRLALLWHMGARWTLPVAAAELAVDLILGAVPVWGVDAAIGWLGVVRPVLAYGAATWAVRRLAAREGAAGVTLLAPPMPLALVSIAAPVLAAFFSLPQALLRGDLTGVESARDVTLSIAAFSVGDVLGTLLIAPPVLWAADRISGRPHSQLARPRVTAVMESIAVLALATLAGEMLRWLGLGSQSAPALIAVAWIGLRFGRVPAWCALLFVCAMVLPRTVGVMDTADRLQFHLGLASVVMTGYLAGSFHDAQTRARADMERRDRLLFQAERLKTLRAMSVAVIHEISQPLSTLAIEARHLHELTVDAPAEVATTAALIDRKAAHLSDLVRRLRRYGGRAVDEPSPLPLATLIESVVALAKPEVQASDVGIAVAPVDPSLAVMAQEVELAQAVVNLIRNALQACGAGGEVMLSVAHEGEAACIAVTNRCVSATPTHPGMGVGTLVARAIVEAHGGTLSLVRAEHAARAVITLPLIGAET
ncbi:ATP-binding protein [Sphingomonas sp.]|uniref:ATP-binding protein n=1 Tax=Sphingomonas sp. TaxID=28214 RepID=UPI0035C86201